MAKLRKLKNVKRQLQSVEFVIEENLKSIFCRYVTETENALCVKSNYNQIVWIPFDLLFDESPDDSTEYCFMISEKIAFQKELIK